MLGHIIATIKPKAAAVTTPIASRPINADDCRERIEATINDLHALSRRGLWWMVWFMAVSAVMLYCREAGIFAMVPAEVKEMFGDTPPLPVLHVVLAISWLSALVLILGRRGGDGRPGYSWYNIVLPAVFYPLYLFSDPTGTHFPAVFAAGILLLLIEYVTVRSYARRAIREETARLTMSSCRK